MLQIFDLSQSKNWDNVVRTFTNYDVYWLSGYVKAFNLHGDGYPLLFYYEDDFVRGINVVMKRDISNDYRFEGKIKPGVLFDFATPYGYGGWIIEGDNIDHLFETYFDWCTTHNIVSEFVRFHPVVGNHTYSEKAYEVIPLGNTVSMDLRNHDTIWSNLSSKNRNVIRKAIKSGIEIKHGMSDELFESFIQLYNATMKKDNAEDYYYFQKDFYDCIQDDLRNNATVFYAELQGQIIASSIMIFANGRLNYHLSGSDREFQHLAPSNLLLYRAAEWGNENGMISFHLGGGVGSGEDNLFKFKRAFYKLDDLPRFHIGKKIYNIEKYEELVSTRCNIKDENYFPKYRG